MPMSMAIPESGHFRLEKTIPMYWSLIKKSPCTILLPPLLLLAITSALGIWGCYTINLNMREESDIQALNVADVTTRDLQMHLFQAISPGLTLASMASLTRSWAMFSDDGFLAMAEALYNEAPANSVRHLLIAPNGVFSIYYPAHPTAPIINAFSTPQYEEQALILVRTKQMIVNWNLDLETQQMLIATATIPIFASNVDASEDFGRPPGVQNCSICYDVATRTKFMGFITVSLNFSNFADNTQPALAWLVERKFNFLLQSVPTAGADSIIIAHSDVLPPAKLAVTFQIYSANWKLTIAHRSEYHNWFGWSVAVVIICSLIASLLLLYIMVTRSRQQRVLSTLVPKSVIDRTIQQEGFLDDDQPEVKLGEDTPAQKILMVVSDSLEGRDPSVQDLLLIRTAILQSYNLYEPIDLKERMVATLSKDVVRSLMHTLGGNSPSLAESSECENDVSQHFNDSDMRALQHNMSMKTMLSTLITGQLDSTRYAVEVSYPSLSGYDDGGLFLKRARSRQSSLLVPGAIQGAAAPGPPRVLVDDISTRGSKSSLGPSGLPTEEGPRPETLNFDGTKRRKSANVSIDDGLKPCSRNRTIRGSLMDSVLAGVMSRRSKTSELVEDAAVATGGAVNRSLTAKRNPSFARGNRFSFSSPQLPGNPPAPPPALLTEVEAFLADAATSWTFDAFKFSKITQGHGLSTLAYFLLHDTGLVSQFKLLPIPLAKFLMRIEAGYDDHPYHNSIHASDVLQTYNVILCRGGFVPLYADPITHLSCLLAAIIHDFQHKGVTNDFLINSSDELAVIYNDRSPMENHHCSAAFRALRSPGCQFLSVLSKAEMATVRKVVITLVLATDMKQHFTITSKFASMHHLSSSAERSGEHSSVPRKVPSIMDVKIDIHPMARGSRVHPEDPDSTGMVAKGSMVPGSMPRCSEDRSCNAPVACANAPVTPLDEAERLLSLQLALKVADLGHLGEPMAINRQWVGRLENEFFNQGDKEKLMGLPLSPLFDRDKPGVTKSQVGFFTFVAIPTFQNLARVFRNVEPMYKDFLMPNFEYWKGCERNASTSNM